MKLQGKVAVITGGSMGIGEAIAKLFLAEGAKLVLCARDVGRVEAATQRIGATSDQVLTLACDVSRRDQVQALAQAALRQFSQIDIWVNNAGFGLNDSIEKMDLNQLRTMFDTNYFGVMECMQAAIPIMRQQGGGEIVNISSVAGHICVAYMSGYGATKHALNALGEAGRMELSRHNINVLTVCPGYIATDHSRSAAGSQDLVDQAGSGGLATRSCNADNTSRTSQKKEGNFHLDTCAVLLSQQ